MYRFYDYFGDERLSSNDLCVLIAICCNQQFCSKSVPTLSKMTRLGQRTVHRSLKHLEAIGLIKIENINARQRRIWPLIKHVAGVATTQNGHVANQTIHVAKNDMNILPVWQPNININNKEHGDLKIDPEKTAEQMRKFGLTLKVMP